ncbi:MAG TPA: carboxypeptidase-like regulatory domain-containing protein [bacterium]|nr:carboxypeptidase-like regulatory domain-containing protein [bacterium]
MTLFGRGSLLLVCLAATAAVTLTHAPVARATDLRGTIQVRTLGRPAPNAPLLGKRRGYVVALVSVNTGALVARTFTDSAGNYGFRGVPPGSYRLIVGFPNAVREVVIAVPDRIVLDLPPIVVANAP